MWYTYLDFKSKSHTLKHFLWSFFDMSYILFSIGLLIGISSRNHTQNASSIISHLGFLMKQRRQDIYGAIFWQNPVRYLWTFSATHLQMLHLQLYWIIFSNSSLSSFFLVFQLLYTETHFLFRLIFNQLTYYLIKFCSYNWYKQA